MLVGALADAGADQKAITSAIASLDAGAAVSFQKVQRCGIAATQFWVAAQEGQRPRHLAQILDMIGKADLPGRAKHNAQAVFRKLGEAEAEVHRVPLEKVHFHEVGAADSIADIVGTCLAFDLLHIEAVVCSPLNVGSGVIQSEHGLLPVPAPATARLLKDAPVYSRGPAVELTTPTGAAVAATLATHFGVLPSMKIAHTGYGAGARDFPESPNVLRVVLGKTGSTEEALEVSVIEANIDDLNPQVLAYAAERLMEAGALDVSLQPIIMKKGRPGTLLRIIARPEDRQRLSEIAFAETSTLGVRCYSAERLVRERSSKDVETRFGTVRMKVSEEGFFAPEYEDCRKLAQEKGVPLKEIIAEANLQYQKSSR
jgi:pyridinium-3,5-bisthiocarboxylic acid mononucleotide nickel chelatase